METKMLWYLLLEWFGEMWSRNYGDEPKPLVRAELDGMTDEQRLRIAAGVRQWTSSFPPTIPQLLQMGDEKPNDDALIAMALYGETENIYAERLRKTLGSWERGTWDVNQKRKYYRERLAWTKHEDVEEVADEMKELFSNVAAQRRLPSSE